MILVTGGTGNVGRELVDRLLAAGQAVRATSRDPSRARLPRGVGVVAADLMRPESLPVALAGVEAVFLIVHVPGDPHQVENFVRAAQRSAVRHVVFLSSMSVESPSARDLIADQHRAAEDALRASGLAWTFLRPGTFFSNTLSWAPSIQTEGRVTSLHENVPAAPIDPYDVAAVAALMLTAAGHESKSYAMTGPERITPEEQARILGETLRREVHFEEAPREQAIAMVEAMVGDRKAAEAILRGVGGPDVPWARPLPTVEKLIGRRPRTFREWATLHVKEFG